MAVPNIFNLQRPATAKIARLRCCARVISWGHVCLAEQLSSLRCGFLAGNILHEQPVIRLPGKRAQIERLYSQEEA